MRVLYFTRDYTPHDHRFLTALVELGHQVHALRLERANLQLEDRPLPEGVTQLQWSGGRKPFSWRQASTLAGELRRIVCRVDPDVVHAGPVPTVSFIAALAGVRPLASISWGSDLLLDTAQSGWARWRAILALKHSDVLMADCRAVQDKAAGLGFARERMVLFPWGVDLEAFRPDPAGKEPGKRSPDGTFTILSLRTWEPLYGVDGLVRAFVRAAQAEPALRLVLLGSGSQAGLIRGTLEKAGMMDRVTFGGQVSNHQLARFYHAADLYTSASHSDGSSVSLLEALACGLPVLVSDIAGNREWVEPDAQGWLFADGDEEALAQGMLRAYNERARLGEMGKAARRLAEQRANWRQNARKMDQAYEMAVNYWKESRTAK